ncbi:MAG TPA: hypothetical protein VJ755_14870, partial [Gemmatimonadales bacterium]|nr:hypothetical protein [Gemmatimonadales bacterium]
RWINQLDGRYITAIDAGTSVADMDCIAQHTQFVTSTTAAWLDKGLVGHRGRSRGATDVGNTVG